MTTNQSNLVGYLNASVNALIPSLSATADGDDRSSSVCHGLWYDAVLVVPSLLFLLCLAFHAKKKLSYIMISYYALIWVPALLNLACCALQVVYMDEPSSGLDPASRNNTWNVVKAAKLDRAIILTTHSMEEAEALCDRLGIFVDGRWRCIGNAKELKARFGGSYIFTMTTSGDHEEEVEKMASANKVYRLSGTHKFELPKNEVTIAGVFQAVEAAKRLFTVFAWGLTDTTLEDVFIKVATTA